MISTLSLLPLLSVLPLYGEVPSAQVLDLDADGRPDVVLVDLNGVPRLLRQLGRGGFQELEDRAGLPERVAALDWRDVDGDGDLDVLALPRPGSGERARLFEQAAPLVFLEFASAFPGAGLEAGGRAEWIDLDLDQRVDLVWSASERIVVLRQSRRGVFEEAALLATVRPPGAAGLSSGPGVIVGTTSVPGVSALAGPSLICAGTLVDVATGACIEASSQPTIGSLMPLSIDFNVGSSGRVGLGTLTPLERLDVAGRVRAQQGVRFGDGTLQTTAGTRDWNQLVGMPAGFADGIDDNTIYTVGAGLSLAGEQFSIPAGGVTTTMIAAGAVTASRLAPSAVGAIALASDAASLELVTGGGASMAAGSLLVNTVTPAGRVRVRHASTTTSPHLMLTQDGTSTFSRIGMDNPQSPNSWTLAGALTASGVGEQFNVYHSSAGNVLSVGGDGRVGVNTTSPLSELHVQGALHLDGTSRDLSVPSGTAFQLGHFDGTSFTSRLTVSSAGLVTATQDAVVARDLDVNRDLDVAAELRVGSGVLLRSTGVATFGGLLTAQNVTVQGTLQLPAGTRRRTLSATSFQTTGGFLLLSSGVGMSLANQLAAPGSSCRAYAGIELPHGAVVTRVSASVNDSQPSGNVSVNLLRKAFDSSPSNDAPQSLALATSNSSAGDQLPTDTSISFATIDTVGFSYYIEIAATAPNVGELGILLYSVQVEYTTADPLE